jgi:hypothetical protein
MSEPAAGAAGRSGQVLPLARRLQRRDNPGGTPTGC